MVNIRRHDGNRSTDVQQHSGWTAESGSPDRQPAGANPMLVRFDFRILIAVSLALISNPTFAAEPAPDANASRAESLTSTVRRMMAEQTAARPDPWKPCRDRPKQFAVIPGEQLSYSERLTSMALAGLVNRGGPRLFVRGHYDFNADADRFWISRLAQQYGMDHRELKLDEALAEFKGVARGAVLIDENLPATQTVALTLAGALQLVPAMPEMQKRLEAAGVRVLLDLRGTWTSHVAAQQWLLDVIGPSLSNQLIGFIGVRDKSLWGIADYLVMHGGMIADLSSDQQHADEYSLRDKMLSRLEPGSIVWGWCCNDSESQHVAHASRHGLRVLCATNCPNLSFFAGVRPIVTEYRQRSPAPCSKPVEKKLYLTFVLTDGDSIPILLTRQWYRWDDPARGKIPFGWEHQPLLADLAPVVFEYYYQTMTENDRLICGPSGAGYTHPAEMPNLDWFIDQTRQYMRSTDLHCVGICADWDERSARAMIRGIPEAVGFFNGWGEEPNRKLLLAGGKPFVPYWLCLSPLEQSPNKTKDAEYFAQEAARIRRIVQRSGLPCFIAGHLSCYWSTPSDVPKLLEALGDDIPHEVLLPDQFLQTAGDYYRDKILLDPVDRVQLMPGANTSLALNLTSTRSAATPCQVRLTSPAGTTAEPPAKLVTLDAGGTAQISTEIRATGTLNGKEITVLLEFGGQTNEYKLPIRCLPPVENLPQGLSLCSVWQAAQLPHSTGSAVDDADASDGKAWQAVPGKDQADTQLAWGPYEELPPGRYAAAFRLKSAGQPGAPVARIDVFNYWMSREGQEGTRAQRTVEVQDLGGPNRYGDVWVEFEHGQIGKLEYRVRWPGQSPLSLDRIVIFRKT